METFESHRPALFGIAYRLTGSVAEAEDAVQEAFLRWRAAPQAEVRSPRAFLSTVVTRLCLDRLKAERVRKESYPGPWLPEPLPTDGPVDPESISLAFLVLLESLTPLERAVYLLHEVFDYTHAEVAEIVGRDEASCRQLLLRARRSITARRPRFAPTREAHERLLTSFAEACRAGDPKRVERLLAEDAAAWSDGGGRATAARVPIRGARAVARAWVGFARKADPGARIDVQEVNGWPALVVRVGGRVVSVISIETDGERILAIRTVLNPEKLAAIADAPRPV